MALRPVPKTEAKELVTVYALKEHVQRSVKHLPSGYKFDAEGKSRWPLDQFTKRRLRDGDVSLEAPAKETKREEQPRRQPARQQAIEPPSSQS